MVGGRGVVLAPESGVTEGELFLCIDVDAGQAEALVRQAAVIERDWLPVDKLQSSVEVAFDPEAERITADATEQVESALEHARRIGARADDHERLARAQAQQVVAHAQVQAREILDDAREKAQRIADAITGHASTVLRNAEDRTRDLRWQQQQLGSFLAEMNELLRATPRGTPAAADDRSDADSDDEATPPE